MKQRAARRQPEELRLGLQARTQRCRQIVQRWQQFNSTLELTVIRFLHAGIVAKLRRAAVPSFIAAMPLPASVILCA